MHRLYYFRPRRRVVGIVVIRFSLDHRVDRGIEPLGLDRDRVGLTIDNTADFEDQVRPLCKRLGDLLCPLDFGGCQARPARREIDVFELVGLDGHAALTPWIWTAIGLLSIAVLILMIHPLRYNPVMMRS